MASTASTIRPTSWKIGISDADTRSPPTSGALTAPGAMPCTAVVGERDPVGGRRRRPGEGLVGGGDVDLERGARLHLQRGGGQVDR